MVDKSLGIGVEFPESTRNRRLHRAFYSTDDENAEDRDEGNLSMKAEKGACMSTRVILNHFMCNTNKKNFSSNACNFQVTAKTCLIGQQQDLQQTPRIPSSKALAR